MKNSCTNCGHQNDGTKKFCRKCGAVLVAASKRSIMPLAIITALLCLVALIVGIIYFTGNFAPGQTPVATESVLATPASEPSASTSRSDSLPSVGDIIRFGPFDWRVLQVDGNYVMIITDRVIDIRVFHNPPVSVTWETSDIRHWLNGEFLNRFSDQERGRIIQTMITNDNNPWDFSEWGGNTRTPGGNNTTDWVFLLSIDEVLRFFGDSGLVNEGAPIGINERFNNQPVMPEFGIYSWGIHDRYSAIRIARNLEGQVSCWWLRTPGGSFYSAAFVYEDGRLNIGGYYFTNVGGIRPALWLHFD